MLPSTQIAQLMNAIAAQQMHFALTFVIDTKNSRQQFKSLPHFDPQYIFH